MNDALIYFKPYRFASDGVSSTHFYIMARMPTSPIVGPATEDENVLLGIVRQERDDAWLATVSHEGVSIVATGKTRKRAAMNLLGKIMER